MRKVYMFNAKSAITFVTQFSDFVLRLLKDMQLKHLAVLGAIAIPFSQLCEGTGDFEG